MTITKRVYKNFFALAVSEIIGKIFGFFSLIYLARVLDTEGFGKINFSQAIVAYFLLFSNLGLDLYGTREIAKNKEKHSKIINNIISMELMLAFISFFVLMIFALIIRKPLEIKKITMFFGLNLFVFAFTIDWVFMGIEKMEFITIAKITRSILSFILIIFFIKTSDNLLWFPIIDVVTKLVLALVLIIFYVKIVGTFKLEYDFLFWKNIFKKSWPLGISSLMAMVYYNFDLILLGFMKGESDVGLYAAAYKIIDNVIIIPGLIIRVMFPLLASSFADKERMDANFRQFVRLMFNLGIPIGFLGMMLAPGIIGLVYGNSFQESVLPLKILSWNVALIFMNTSFNRNLVACGKEKIVMKSLFWGALINTILNFLLIPKYSLIGAAIATIFTEFFVLIYSYQNFNKVVPINIFKISIKPILGSILMFLLGLAAMSFCDNFFIIFVFSLTIYSLFLYFSKETTVFVNWR